MEHPILNIRIYPDPVLKKVAEPVEEITDVHRQLINSMIETMYTAPGVGLAAPQVGISQRIIVIHVPGEKEGEKGNPQALINPRIMEKGGEIIAEEGCLSVPEVNADIKRSSYVEIAFQDLKGNEKQIKATNLIARIIQHEIDHLDGILFIDYLGRIRRDLIKRKFRKNPPPSPVIAPSEPEFLQAFK